MDEMCAVINKMTITTTVSNNLLTTLAKTRNRIRQHHVHNIVGNYYNDTVNSSVSVRECSESCLQFEIGNCDNVYVYLIGKMKNIFTVELFKK